MNATKNRIAIQEYKHNGQFVAGTNTDEHLYAFDRQALEQAVRAVNSYDELLADREYMKRYQEAYCHQVTVIQAMREALEAIVARIEGDFDHAALVKQGVLTLDSKADIKGFAKTALALANGSRD